MCICCCIYKYLFLVLSNVCISIYVFIAHSIDQRQEIQFTTLLCEMSPHKSFLLLCEKWFSLNHFVNDEKFRFIFLLFFFCFFNSSSSSDPLFYRFHTHEIRKIVQICSTLWSNLLILILVSICWMLIQSYR